MKERKAKCWDNTASLWSLEEGHYGVLVAWYRGLLDGLLDGLLPSGEGGPSPVLWSAVLVTSRC